jgi:hypothetical protein
MSFRPISPVYRFHLLQRYLCEVLTADTFDELTSALKLCTCLTELVDTPHRCNCPILALFWLVKYHQGLGFQSIRRL